MRKESRITRYHYKQPPPPWIFSVFFKIFFLIVSALIHEAIVPFCNQNLDTRMSKERPKRNIIQKKYVSGHNIYRLTSSFRKWQ